MKTKGIIVTVFLLVFGGTGLAGWLDTTLEGVGKKLGNRAVNDAGNSAYDAAKGGVRDSGKDKPAEGKGSAPRKSTPADVDQRAERARDSSSPGTVRQGDAAPANDGPAPLEEAESVYSRFDYIPGDKTIFSDDFSDTDVGEFPRKWHLNGPKGGKNAPIEVAEYQGRRF